MDKITNFYDLNAWREAHKLTLTIYKLTANFPKEEKYGIVDQLRRAASSISANIAEGFGRFHFADKIKFYYQSRGSLNEVQNFLLLAKDLKILEENLLKEIWKQTKGCEMLLSGLIRSAERQK
jgi:four helix bundle protein